MSWDVITLDFGGEETANFGTREESGTALFEVQTLATISKSSQGQAAYEVPHVTASGSQAGLCVAADSHASVFNEGCQLLDASLSVESAIDLAAWVYELPFMVLAERNGTVHVYHSGLKQLLMSQKLLERGENDLETECFKQIIITENKEGKHLILLLTSRGTLYQLSQVDLRKLDQVLQNGDGAGALKLQGQIVLDEVDLSDVHTESVTDLAKIMICGEIHLVTAGAGTSVLAIWKCMDQIAVRRKLPPNIFVGEKIIKCVSSGNYIFTLDEEHKLCCWNASLLLMASWPLRVKDFFLTTDSNSDATPQFKLVMLTVSDQKESFLKIYSIPSMQCTYTLSVGPVSVLASTPYNQESIYLVEGRGEEDDESKQVSMLMVRCIMEALPETRFHRLLHRKKFEEAEKFGKLFGLDINLVHRSMALSLLDQASMWSPTLPQGSSLGPSGDENKLCDDLMACLEKIPDVEFVVDVCSNATMPVFDDTARILQYAKTRLSKVKSKVETNIETQDLLSMVLDKLHRLKTFRLVYGSSKYSSTSWELFLSGSMLDELLLHLSQGYLSRASIIWNRHKEAILGVMSEDILDRLLKAIPGETPSQDVIIWLRDDIIPLVCQTFSQGKKLLITWIEERVASLEVTEKAAWPGNGLELAELMLRSNQHFYKASWGFHLSQALTETNSSGCRDSLERLKKLVNKLQELQMLHSRYKCYLTLDQFSKETTESISFRMLERVAAPELVPGTISKCIVPYARDHKLEVDNLLLKYIEDLLSTRSLLATYEASWEAKAITVIKCIKDLTSQLGAIHALMQKAPVPWSRVMENLVQYGLSLKHPVVAMLEERHDIMKLKDMFMKYDLRSVTLGDTDNMKLAIKNILSGEEPSALQDALRVVKAYPNELSKTETYLTRFRYLIESKQIERCVAMLSSLPHQEAQLYLSRILSWAQTFMDNPAEVFLDDVSKDYRVIVGQAASRLLQTDLFTELSAETEKEFLQVEELQCLLQLQMEYGLVVPLSSYRDDAFRSQLLRKAVVEHYQEMSSGNRKKENCGAEDRKNRDLKPGNFVRVLRLGEILGVSASELRGEIALKAANTGELNTAITICSDLSEPDCTPDVAYTLYQVSHAICIQLASGHDILSGSSAGDLIQKLLSLVQKATAFCHPDFLVDCLDLGTKIHSLKDLCDQCESGDYGISMQMGAAESKKDPYQEYTFDTFFKEDSLVLSSEDIIPVAASFALACQPKVRPKNALPLQQARVSGQPVLVQDRNNENEEEQMSYIGELSSSGRILCQTLKEHNQCCLAFHYVIEMLATSLVHVSVNMGTKGIQDELTTAAVDKEVKIMTQVAHVATPNFATLQSILLNKIFSCRTVDGFMALYYITIHPSKEKIKKLVYNAGQNYKKILAIAQVGCEMARMNQYTAMQTALNDVATSALWGDRLAKIKVSFKEAFMSMEQKRLLLPQLITHPQTSLELITEYCRDFKLDEQDALMMYVRLLLLPHDHDEDGYHGNSKQPLDKKVILLAVSMIQKKAALVKMLQENVDKIDCYDYEMLRLVLRIIKDNCSGTAYDTPTTEMGLKLLDYLEAYTRTKPPSEYEVMFQHEDQEGPMLTTKPLSPLSKTRLPFHPLVKGGQWKILRHELSEDTLGKLFPIAELLRLPTDQLYVATIQNMVKHQGMKNTSEKDDVDEKGMHPSCKLTLETLKKIKDLLLQIQDPEMAVVTAHFIARELKGKQKEISLKVCERLACRWKELSEEGTPEYQKASATHQCLVTEYRAVSTEEALYRHGLGEPPYIHMIKTPAKLIFKLYEHPSIEQHTQGFQRNLPDINGAVEEIATVNNCNLEKIRLRLMEEWMPQPIASRQDEMTMNFTFGSGEDEDEIPEEERSLMRLKYLLQRQNPEKTIMFLLNVAFKQTSTHVTTGCQVRALRCLFSLSDDDVISKVSKQSVSELREYLKSLVYLAEFEALNIAMDLNAFKSSNKSSLVRGLWKNHNHEPRSVQLVAKLCLEYGIHDKNLWNSVLQQLQKFGMLDYLEYVLVQLAGLEELRSMQCLPKVWSAILAAPFMSICTPLTDEQANRCRNVLSLVQKYPILYDLDFIRLSCQFLRVDMHAEALACLLHIPDRSKRDTQINTLLDTRHVLILDSLSQLKEKKQPLPEHENVVDEVLKHLASRSTYETVRETKHFVALIHYLAKQDQLHDLVQKAIQADRVPDAIKLVHVFHMYNPVSPAAHGSTDLEILKVYLLTHQLEDEAMNIVNLIKEEDNDGSKMET